MHRQRTFAVQIMTLTCVLTLAGCGTDFQPAQRALLSVGLDATQPAIDIEKATNGQDADLPPGPAIAVGDPIEWTYVLTNTGDAPLAIFSLTDDKGVVINCPLTRLEPGESMTCTGQGVAEAGPYVNVADVLATGPDGSVVGDFDASHYFGGELPSNPAIDIEKATNGYDADEPTGPTVAVGSAVEWTYVVSNTGDVALSDILVEDDQGVVVTCPIDVLAPGESMTCVASGEAMAGQYENIARVTGTAADGTVVSDADASHYLGVEAESCGLGYWKNHVASWAATGLDPNQLVDSVFAEAAAYPAVGSATLLEALRFKGGPTVEAGARLLLRHAVVALLNAAHPDVAYPGTVAEIVEAVDAALATGDRRAMLKLKSSLNCNDDFECDCPLD